MLRLLAVILVALVGVQLPRSAQASTLTFDLTLTNTLYGPENGVGTLTVDAPIAGGVDAFTSNGGGLDSLNITIDNQTFTLANALGLAQATFLNGALSSISYVGQLNNFQLNLDTAGLFYLYNDLSNFSLASAGTISAVLDPPAAPLPPTAVLFAGGLLVFGFLTSRRKRFGLPSLSLSTASA